MTKFPSKRSVSYTLPFPIVPASRPKVSRWGVYYPKTYNNWKKRAADFFLDQPPVNPLLEGPLLLYLWVYIDKPKTTNRNFPRGDVDNYEKSILDAITASKKVWYDDDQVVISLKMKLYGIGRTEVTISELW